MVSWYLLSKAASNFGQSPTGLHLFPTALLVLIVSIKINLFFTVKTII